MRFRCKAKRKLEEKYYLIKLSCGAEKKCCLMRPVNYKKTSSDKLEKQVRPTEKHRMMKSCFKAERDFLIE